MTETDVAPALRFALREYRLYINLGLLASLGNPLYLEFLFDGDRKRLVISGSMKRSKYSYEIPKRIYRDADDECYISRMTLTEAFRVRMDWDRRENYRVTGQYVEHIGMALFDLTRAVIVGKEDAIA